MRGVESQIGEVFEARTRDPHYRHVSQGPRPYRAAAITPPAAPAISPRWASASISRNSVFGSAGSRPAPARASTAARSTTPRWRFSRATSRRRRFRFAPSGSSRTQIPCHLTYTNARTHEIIRGGIDRSPMYSGVIQSRGPRYCPSVEDKVMRFRDKERHQIFLEPEGRDTDRGLSQRPLDQPAARRAARDGAVDQGAGARRDHAARLRDRVRFLRPDAAAAVARDQAGRRDCSSPARSTALPATKKRARRD